MDNPNNELNDDSVKLMAYQKGSQDGSEVASPPLATMDDEESPPTPPPPLPPLPSTPPPRSPEAHAPSGSYHDDREPSESATLNKSHDSSLLVKESSRPKSVKGTTHVLSGLYAKLLVAATAVLVTTEILPNSIPLFFYHGYIFTFLLAGSVLCFLCIYMSMCLQRCPGVEEMEELDEECGDTKKVLRRVKYRGPEISIFFRVGALVFGLGTLIGVGLEIATLFTNQEDPCVDQLNFIQPILHALFTFMQMHFLSLNSQRAIQNLGWCRHLILMHLVATNLAIWLRLIVWETAKSWLDDHHTTANSSDKWPPTGYNMTVHALFSDGKHSVYMSPNCWWVEDEDERMEDLLRLRQCYQNSTIGAIWDKAQPFILPFIIQYCLIGAVVNYVLWECFSTRRRRITRRATSWTPRRQDVDSISSKQDRKVDCKGSSKGLFLGLLVLAVGIVVLILFFVLTNNQNLKDETLFVMITVHCCILGLSALGILFGICRVSSMCTDHYRSHHLHSVLQCIGVSAVYVQGICSLVVGTTNISNPKFIAVTVDGGLMILQSLLQSTLFHKLSQKGCSYKCQHEGSRPGRQIVTFLAFTNLVLWMTESFTDHNYISSQLQLQFFGILPWGLLCRLLLPLVIFYRFHSSVYLMEVWKSGYNKDR